MRFYRILVIFVLAAAGLPAASIPVTRPEEAGLSGERLKRVHEAVQRHIEQRNIAGAVTLVSRKGRLAHLEAQGSMNLEAKKPMARDSIFRIFSMTKPVIGVAILMMMEEGKLRLEDPVSRFIPEFKEMKVAVPGPRPLVAVSPAPPAQFNTVAAAREITIRDMLTHVSGLGSGAASSAEISRLARKPTETLADYIPRLATTPLDFQPGARWSYSPSAAWDTMARIVEIVSGQTIDQFLRQRLFTPLGMRDTFFYPPPDKKARIVSTYRRVDGVLKPAENQDRLVSPVYFSGGGGLFSTADDYSQFANMLLEGGKWNGRRFLSPKTVELMTSVFVPDTFEGRTRGDAFGLSVRVINDPIALGWRVSAGSFGWNGALGTHYWVDPKEKVVGVLMVQVDNPNRQLDRDFNSAVMQAIVD